MVHRPQSWRTRDVFGQRNRPVETPCFVCLYHLPYPREILLAGFVHVVDDDASFRTAIERRLKKAGYAVATYPTAQHLLERLPDEGELGCILLDVRIPDLSGPDLQDRLSKLGSTLPIVFLSGHADVATTVRTIKAGAEDFLTKPVSAEQLLRAIERAMAHHEASRGQKQKL